MEQYLEDRLELWYEHAPLAMLALGQMLGSNSISNVELPAIVITDNNDEYGFKFYSHLKNNLDKKDETTIIRMENNQAMMIMPVPILTNLTRWYHEAFSLAVSQDPSEDKMWAAILAFGGMTLLQVPVEPMIPIGSA